MRALHLDPNPCSVYCPGRSGIVKSFINFSVVDWNLAMQGSQFLGTGFFKGFCARVHPLFPAGYCFA